MSLLNAGSRLLLMVAVMAGSGCAAGDSHALSPEEAARLLWLPADAAIQPSALPPIRQIDGRNVYIDGSVTVVFRVKRRCESLSASVTERFAATEWVPQQMRLLNPAPTSFSSGCRPHGGGVVSPGAPAEPYTGWTGEWRNRSGDFIAYHLGGQGAEQGGVAMYVPARVAESTRRSVDEMRRRMREECRKRYPPEACGPP